MRITKIILAAIALFATAIIAGAQAKPIAHFNKVIVSPFIQVTFVEGNEENVTIDHLLVDSSKLHIEIEGGTLRLYLEGAKDVPGHRTVYNGDGGKQNLPLYPNHAVVATITYKSLEALSIRGEEPQVIKSPLVADKFKLRVYGESNVTFNEMHVKELDATMYGEGSLEIKSGSADEQDYTCYGEGKINTTAITGKESWLTAFGEAEFRLNVTDRIKFTTFGAARVRYMGNPEIVKGIHIGEVDLKKID